MYSLDMFIVLFFVDGFNFIFIGVVLFNWIERILKGKRRKVKEKF